MKFKRDHENTSIDLIEKLGIELQEKTRAAAAPRKPKNGAVSSPLNGAIITETTSDGSDQRTEIFRFPQRERERERFHAPISVTVQCGGEGTISIILYCS